MAFLFASFREGKGAYVLVRKLAFLIGTKYKLNWTHYLIEELFRSKTIANKNTNISELQSITRYNHHY